MIHGVAMARQPRERERVRGGPSPPGGIPIPEGDATNLVLVSESSGIGISFSHSRRRRPVSTMFSFRFVKFVVVSEGLDATPVVLVALMAKMSVMVKPE